MNLKLSQSKLVFALLLLIISLLFACGKDEVSIIEYPESGFYGDNILLITKTEYTNQKNSLNCKIPKNKSIKIIITGNTVERNTVEITDFDTYITFTGIWGYGVSTVNNWAITSFDYTNYTQTFASIDGGLTCELLMLFDKGTYQIEYYENDSSTPTAMKTINVNY